MRKKWPIIGVCILLGLGICVGLADFILNRAFYNPYRKAEGNAASFQETVFALVPSAEFTYTAPYSPGTPRHFSRFTQAFYFQKPSLQSGVRLTYIVDGQFEYLFGKAKVVYASAPEKPLVYSQGDYLDGTPLDVATLDDDRYYLAQIGFTSLFTEDALTDAAADLASRDQKAMILRAILQTSDDEDDVALGVAGSGIPIDVNWGTHRLSIAANNALRNLSLNQREADVFIGSGLFGEIEVDFSQRLEYLESNGVRPIGMSVFAKGSDLSAWLKKYDMKLVDAQADGE